MDKRGEVDATEGQDIISRDVLHFIIWLAIFSICVYFIVGFARGEALQESFYAQQIAQVIDSTPVGTNVTMDISPLVALAYRHAKPTNETIFVDSTTNKVTISTRQSGSTSFYFFKNVEVLNLKVNELATSAGVSTVTFSIGERKT